MKDGTAASILLTSELENLLADIRVGWESSFKLRNFSTGHVLGWGSVPSNPIVRHLTIVARSTS